VKCSHFTGNFAMPSLVTGIDSNTLVSAAFLAASPLGAAGGGAAAAAAGSCGGIEARGAGCR
jgi:hypothetical protein